MYMKKLYLTPINKRQNKKTNLLRNYYIETKFWLKYHHSYKE